MKVPDYRQYIHDRFLILPKGSQTYQPFKLNPIQEDYLAHWTGRDIILKARQQGFSSLILALFATDFLLMDNTLSIVLADVASNAQDLLDRVKKYVEEVEDVNRIKIPLKYNTRNEIYNNANDSRYIIGTAENVHFGRSKTINNLHLSEAAYYKDFPSILAGAGTAVVPNGRIIIETTANGFNEFKDFWDNASSLGNGYNPMFYPASHYYSDEFLSREKARLGKLFPQEFPETPIEAFLNSGELYFDIDSLNYHYALANKYKEKYNVPSISAI